MEEMIENIVRKGKKFWLPSSFLLFLQCFQRAFLLGVIQTQDYFVKGERYIWDMDPK